MTCGLIKLFLLIALTSSGQSAQTGDHSAASTVLPGLQVKPVPEIVRAQLPELPRGQGLMVEQLGFDLPAELSQLNRQDVLASYDGNPLYDIEQFKRLVRGAKPERKAPLVVFRGGKKLTFTVTLQADNKSPSTKKSAIKAGGPPAVAMECTFLDGGKLQIKLEYYSEKNSKLESATYSGSLPEIEKQVREQKLPPRTQDLVDVALKRLRSSNQK